MNLKQCKNCGFVYEDKGKPTCVACGEFIVHNRKTVAHLEALLQSAEMDITFIQKIMNRDLDYYERTIKQMNESHSLQMNALYEQNQWLLAEMIKVKSLDTNPTMVLDYIGDTLIYGEEL